MKERLTKRIDNKTYFIIKTEGNDFYSDGEDLTFNYYDKEVQKILDRLAEYEDLEEQGLIVRLPCKVGDTVYEVFKFHIPQFIQETTIDKIIVTKKGLRLKLERNSFYETSISSLGKTIFLTRAEAEKKLKELKGEE